MLLGMPAVGHAQAVVADSGADAGNPDVSLEDVMTVFQEQSDVVVETASKTKQRSSEAPAVITAITRQEIADRGYRSVAEALADIPGLYVVDDQFLPNVGVRGVNGGLRSWSRIFKVMIDGQEVDFRPDGSNWLGPELIPLSVVERIEVIRGPASALFGANAFLGVVNIITRKADSIRGGSVQVGMQVLNGNPGQTVEGVTGIRVPVVDVDVVAAASYAHLDRSGLTVPNTYKEFDPKAYANPGGGQRVTQDDIAEPMSLYLRAERGLSIGNFSLSGSYQNLSSGANFQDWGTLAPDGNLLDLHNDFARLQYVSPANEHHSVQAALAFAEGAADTNDEHLDTGDPGKFYQRHMGYKAINFLAEYTYTFTGENRIKAGIDTTDDWEDLLAYDVILKKATANLPAGYREELNPAKHLLLTSEGLYAQGSLAPWERLLLTGNVRVDRYSVNENNHQVVPTWRAAAVLRLAEGSTIKALYGRSFKAPSPLFRFAPGGLGVTDILGNPDLTAEIADTGELAGTWAPWFAPGLALNAAAFLTKIQNFTEFVNTGGNFQAENRAAVTSLGGEFWASYRTSWVDLFGWYSYANATRPYDSTSFFASIDDSDAGVVQLSRYPTHQAKVGALVPFEAIHLQLSADVGVVGERRASESSILYNNRRVYSLPPYFPVDLALSTRNLRLIEGRETRAQVRVVDLLDQHKAEVGFNGADIPGLGRQWVFTIYQQF